MTDGGTMRTNLGTRLAAGMMGVALLAGCGRNAGAIPEGDRGTLVRAVREEGGRSAEGSESSLLCSLASDHARAMATSASLTHDGCDGRAEEILRAGGKEPGEIVAYTSETDIAAAAVTCARSWHESPGHWEIMSSAKQAYCYTLAQGRDGYYCVGIVADGIR